MDSRTRSLEQQAWHSLDGQQALDALDASAHGLSVAEAAARLQPHAS
jgi:hypothetical protein